MYLVLKMKEMLSLKKKNKDMLYTGFEVKTLFELFEKCDHLKDIFVIVFSINWNYWGISEVKRDSLSTHTHWSMLHQKKFLSTFIIIWYKGEKLELNLYV